MTYHYKATFCSTIYTCQYVQQRNVVVLIFLPLRSVMCVSTKSNTPKATQAQILVHFSNEWGVRVGRSTISDILRDKVKWFSVSKDSGDVLRAKTAMHTPMESVLYTWFTDVRGRGLALSDDMMITKAKEYGLKLGVTDFQYSRGWLAGFKKRHGIRLYKCHVLRPQLYRLVVNNYAKIYVISPHVMCTISMRRACSNDWNPTLLSPQRQSQ